MANGEDVKLTVSDVKKAYSCAEQCKEIHNVSYIQNQNCSLVLFILNILIPGSGTVINAFYA